MRSKEYYYPLRILNVLMRNKDKWFSTEELIFMFACDRKTIYRSMTALETNGFGVEIKRGHIVDDRIVSSQMYYYRYNGVYGI